MFSEPVDPAGVTASGIALVGPSGPVTSLLALGTGDTTVTLTPLSPLEDESALHAENHRDQGPPGEGDERLRRIVHHRGHHAAQRDRPLAGSGRQRRADLLDDPHQVLRADRPGRVGRDTVLADSGQHARHRPLRLPLRQHGRRVHADASARRRHELPRAARRRARPRRQRPGPGPRLRLLDDRPHAAADCVDLDPSRDRPSSRTRSHGCAPTSAPPPTWRSWTTT